MIVIPQNCKARLGFTLVEVILSLGIVTVAITSVMGLLSVSLTTDRQAANDTALAAMTQYVSSTLRAQKFANLASVDYSFAFDVDGRCLSATTNALSCPAGTFFTCTSRMAAAPAVLSSGAGAENAGVFQIPFVWPYPANQQTNEVSLSIASRD